MHIPDLNTYSFKTGSSTFGHSAVEYLHLLNDNSLLQSSSFFIQLCDVAFNLIQEEKGLSVKPSEGFASQHINIHFRPSVVFVPD